MRQVIYSYFQNTKKNFKTNTHVGFLRSKKKRQVFYNLRIHHGLLYRKSTNSSTLESGKNVLATVINFWAFSRGYVLTKGSYIYELLDFYFFNPMFSFFFPMAMYIKISNVCYFRGKLRLFKRMFIVFSQVFQGLRLFRTLVNYISI